MNKNTTKSQTVPLALHTLTVVSCLTSMSILLKSHFAPSQTFQPMLCVGELVLIVSTLGRSSTSVIFTVSSISLTLMITIAVSANSPSVTITLAVSFVFFSKSNGIFTVISPVESIAYLTVSVMIYVTGVPSSSVPTILHPVLPVMFSATEQAVSLVCTGSLMSATLIVYFAVSVAPKGSDAMTVTVTVGVFS